MTGNGEENSLETCAQCVIKNSRVTPNQTILNLHWYETDMGKKSQHLKAGARKCLFANDHKELIDYQNQKWVSVLLHSGIKLHTHPVALHMLQEGLLPHLGCQQNFPCLHPSLFSLHPFFSGPLPCLHLSDPVITADPSLDLSTAKEITLRTAEHIGLPVWKGGERLPDPLMLINCLRLWGFKKVSSGTGWCETGRGCYSRL